MESSHAPITRSRKTSFHSTLEGRAYRPSAAAPSRQSTTSAPRQTILRPSRSKAAHPAPRSRSTRPFSPYRLMVHVAIQPLDANPDATNHRRARYRRALPHHARAIRTSARTPRAPREPTQPARPHHPRTSIHAATSITPWRIPLAKRGNHARTRPGTSRISGSGRRRRGSGRRRSMQTARRLGRGRRRVRHHRSCPRGVASTGRQSTYIVAHLVTERQPRGRRPARHARARPPARGRLVLLRL
jgi:hypothetical protein